LNVVTKKWRTLFSNFIWTNKNIFYLFTGNYYWKR